MAPPAPFARAGMASIQRNDCRLGPRVSYAWAARAWARA